MSSEEVTLWLAKERVDPIPDLWTMYGVLTSLLANMASIYGGRKPKFTPEDFIPGRSRKKRHQTPEQMMAVVSGIARRIEKNSRSG